jgi:hypothetical protein
MVEGNVYYCDTCQLYIGYSAQCIKCGTAAAKIGWMVTNDSKV